MPAVEEALFILYESYDRLGLTELRDDTRRVLEKNYPNSEFFNPKKTSQKSWWKLWQLELTRHQPLTWTS